MVIEVLKKWKVLLVIFMKLFFIEEENGSDIFFKLKCILNYLIF